MRIANSNLMKDFDATMLAVVKRMEMPDCAQIAIEIPDTISWRGNTSFTHGVLCGVGIGDVVRTYSPTGRVFTAFDVKGGCRHYPLEVVLLGGNSDSEAF